MVEIIRIKVNLNISSHSNILEGYQSTPLIDIDFLPCVFPSEF